MEVILMNRKYRTLIMLGVFLILALLGTACAQTPDTELSADDTQLEYEQPSDPEL